jgi:hypothetical protein
VVLAATMSSCGGRPSLYPVRGRIESADGESLEGAEIRFCAEDTALQEYPCPRGVVGKDGSFQLTTYARNEGAPAGRYKVTVTLEVIPEQGERDDARVVTPGRYANPTTSDISATVPKGGGELPPFTLTPDEKKEKK